MPSELVHELLLRYVSHFHRDGLDRGHHGLRKMDDRLVEQLRDERFDHDLGHRGRLRPFPATMPSTAAIRRAGAARKLLALRPRPGSPSTSARPVASPASAFIGKRPRAGPGKSSPAPTAIPGRPWTPPSPNLRATASRARFRPRLPRATSASSRPAPRARRVCPSTRSR